jgi:hypothetical protein
MTERPNVLSPVAIGFNKVVFQKGATTRLNDMLVERFPRVQHIHAQLWGRSVFLFGSNFGTAFDCDASTPHQLNPRERISMDVHLSVSESVFAGRSNDVVEVPVRVRNESDLTFCFSNSPIGLSYHLRSEAGEMLTYDNSRSYFHRPLEPAQERDCKVLVRCPEKPGKYQLEIDLVWEGICWFKQHGNLAPVVNLNVAPGDHGNGPVV